MKDREVWRAAVHGVTKSWAWRSNWTTQFLLVNNVIEDTMLVTYCSITNSYKLNIFKQHAFIISQFLWVKSTGMT